MPTVLRVGPYRFFFYSEEGSEPPHVHIVAAERRAKFWLTPIDLTWNDGFRTGELKIIEEIITANLNLFLEAWNDFFSNQ
jgi:hypothetical protein